MPAGAPARAGSQGCAAPGRANARTHALLPAACRLVSLIPSFKLITRSQAGIIIVTEWNYILMSYNLSLFFFFFFFKMPQTALAHPNPRSPRHPSPRGEAPAISDSPIPFVKGEIKGFHSFPLLFFFLSSFLISHFF